MSCTYTKFTALTAIVLFICSSLVPITGSSIVETSESQPILISQQKQSSILSEQNTWDPENEGDHFPTGCEWWTFHVFLELEDGTSWDVLFQIQYETQVKNRSKIGDLFVLLYCFDRDNGKMHDFTMYERGTPDNDIPLSIKKNMLYVEYRNCTMKGLFPNYIVHAEDKEKGFCLDLNFSAVSLPHWALEEAGTNGWIPWMSSGSLRYYWIPRLNALGNITIEREKSNVTGVGYFEHAWGDFSYIYSRAEPRLTKIKEFVKDIPNLRRIIRWLRSERSRFPLPQSLMFTTDSANGYEWIWAAFDEGWSLYFGAFHLMDCVSEGPVLGVLSLTPDGQTYWDFADINIKYLRQLYMEQFDAYLPLEIEVTARKGDKRLYLRFNTTTDPLIGIIIYPYSKYSPGMGGMQTAGIADGYYQDKEQKVSLHGICSIGPYRQFLTSKHNSLKIEFLRPPQGRGFSVEIESHSLGLEMLFKRQLFPYPDRHFTIQPLPEIPIIEPEIPPNNPDAVCLYVGGDGENNHSKIQDAIDNASAGDTVFVYGGTYVEEVVVNKTIRLIGEDKDKVYLVAGENDGIRVIADNVEITGFTIDSEKAIGHEASALELSSSGNYVHDNNIIKSEWYGIYVGKSSQNIIEYNNIIDDDIGIWLFKSSDNTIRYNNIKFCKWVGLWLWHSSGNNTIHHNNFIENGLEKLDGDNVRNSDRRCMNQWDNNYWDDYIGLNFKRLVDLNRDGVGIIPYRISKFEADQHPMMQPYDI